MVEPYASGARRASARIALAGENLQNSRREGIAAEMIVTSPNLFLFAGHSRPRRDAARGGTLRRKT
jgi:hypothetical protein